MTTTGVTAKPSHHRFHRRRWQNQRTRALAQTRSCRVIGGNEWKDVGCDFVFVGRRTQTIYSSGRKPRSWSCHIITCAARASQQQATQIQRPSRSVRLQRSWLGHTSRMVRLGVMPRLVSKSLSSRATRYIHCRPSPSPSVNVYSTPACQGRACLDGSSRRPTPTPTRTHKHARTHAHAHPHTRAHARACDRAHAHAYKFMAANFALLPFTCPMPVTEMNCWRQHTINSGQTLRRPVVHSC